MPNDTNPTRSRDMRLTPRRVHASRRAVRQFAVVALLIGAITACRARRAHDGCQGLSAPGWQGLCACGARRAHECRSAHAGGFGTGSTAPDASQPKPAPRIDPTILAERAPRRFDRAVLWKPEEKNAIIDPYLAPLVVFESPPGAEPPASFGEPTPPANDGATHVDPAHPTIYWSSEPMADWLPSRRAGDAAPAHDLNHADGVNASATLTTFLLFLPALADRPPSWIALIVLSDETKLPRAWEVVTSEDGGGLLFASRALEDAARKQFGPPLPGRTYALERGLDETPGATVVRLLDDSPVPMGPYLYVDADRRVTTVACRCMASQVGEFVDTRRYTIVGIDRLGSPSAATSPSPQSTGGDGPTANGADADRDAAAFRDRIRHEIQKRSSLPHALRWPEHIEGGAEQAAPAAGP